MTFSALCSATVINCGTDDKMTNKLILHLIYSTSILALLYYFQTMLPAIPTISSLNKCGIMI
jgi:hypothetical protein